jgi:hypothetical protein
VQTELTKEEAELINHYRGCSEFNRGRILAMARNAHQDYQWARKVRENQPRPTEDPAG